MKSRSTLYEMLGVEESAGVPELQAAYRRESNLLESNRATLSSQEFNDKAQLLRVAMSTLADPVTRLSYDAKLAANRRATEIPVPTRALAMRAAGAPAASAEVRADALSLRADALALRADAMLVRAGVDVGGASTAQVVASAAMTGLKRVVRAIGLLVVVCIAAYVITRLMMGDPSARRAAMEMKAHEKTAIQEYYQTYGVRPANMAELELLEAERRRRENQGKQGSHDREKQERDARRFEEESRRRGQEVSEQLRYAEEQARRDAERAQMDEDMKAQRVEQEKRAREEAEQMRIEREQQRWRDSLRAR